MNVEQAIAAVRKHFPKAALIEVRDVSKLELTMERDGRCLKPADQFSSEIFDSITTKKPVVVTIHQARNPQHHSKLWALASKVADFDDDFTDAEDAVEWAKMHIPSMRKEIILNDGRAAIRTKSIAWASMDQLRFERFYDRALYLWAQKIGTDPLTLLEE